jgi:hypothetical protein
MIPKKLMNIKFDLGKGEFAKDYMDDKLRWAPVMVFYFTAKKSAEGLGLILQAKKLKTLRDAVMCDKAARKVKAKHPWIDEDNKLDIFKQIVWHDLARKREEK